MKSEIEIREELELLRKVMNKREKCGYLDDNDFVYWLARISTLEWVLDEEQDNNKIREAIRESLLKELEGD